MPTYQYACTDCAERIEAVQKFTDEPLTVCSLCGGRLRKVFSPVGIVFKGSGFYRNDSRDSAKKEKALNGSASSSRSEPGSSGADSSGSSDSPDAGKSAAKDGGSSGSDKSGERKSGKSSSGSDSSSPSSGSSRLGFLVVLGLRLLLFVAGVVVQVGFVFGLEGRLSHRGRPGQHRGYRRLGAL